MGRRDQVIRDPGQGVSGVKRSGSWQEQGEEIQVSRVKRSWSGWGRGEDSRVRMGVGVKRSGSGSEWV